MALPVFEVLTGNADDANNRVAVGLCDCNPKVLVFATLDDIVAGNFKLICVNAKKHPFTRVTLEPALRTQVKSRADLRGVLSSWMTFREHMPDEPPFDIAKHELGGEDPQQDDAGDEEGATSTPLDASSGAMVYEGAGRDLVPTAGSGAAAQSVSMVQMGDRSRKIVLGALYDSPAIVKNPAQQVHGKLHLIKDYALRYGPAVCDIAALGMAVISQDPTRVAYQVDMAARRHLPNMVAGLATEMAMRVFGDKLRDQRMVDAVQESLERFNIQLPVPPPRPSIHVPPTTNAVREQADRVESLRSLRSSVRRL